MNNKNPWSTTPPRILEKEFNKYTYCPACNGTGEVTKTKKMQLTLKEQQYYKLQGQLDQLELNRPVMESKSYWSQHNSLVERISILEADLGISKHQE